MKLRLALRISSLVRCGGVEGGQRRRGFRRLFFLFFIERRPPRAIDGFRQARLIHGLQQVVHGLQAESLHGVLVVGCNENEMRQFHAGLAQVAHYRHAVLAGHVDVQEDQVRLGLADQLDGFQAVAAGGHHLHFREVPQQVGQLVASQLFVVYDHGG
jgi:hypothetical protein